MRYLISRQTIIATTAAFLVPVVVSAATTITGIITKVEGWVDDLIPIVIGLGLLFFLWGLAKYMLAAGDESAQSEGRRLMVWGVITLFVMVSVWGLVALLGTSFGIGAGGTAPIPQINDAGGGNNIQTGDFSSS